MLEHFIIQASSFAKDIDFIFDLITYVVGFWFFLTQGVIVYFLVKYRKSKNPKAQYITGEKHREQQWIHIPHYLVIICDVIIVGFTVFVWYDIKQDLPKADETIRVIARQWSWDIVYPGPDNKLNTPDDIVSFNELRIQKGKTYHFKLESLDVIHSFSIPVFRLKQDAIPGRIITGWFKAIKTGSYDLQCAEMCGVGHGIMAARVVIEEKEEHQTWLDGMILDQGKLYYSDNNIPIQQ